jgi:galactokinase
LTLADRYTEIFSCGPSIIRAPARVNIIGEHTDYNDGFVLPTTTALYTSVASAPRADRLVRVYSHNVAEQREFDLDATAPGNRGDWIEYIKGVAWMLDNNGHRLRGADLHVTGNIPVGSGLSSSASLEIAVGMALLDASGIRLDPVELAMLCQRAEVEFVGLNCGIMDQLAVACCDNGSAMMLDCRSLDRQSAPIPAALKLLVVDSGVKHQLPVGGYNDRAAECRESVSLLATEIGGLSSLRDLAMAQLQAHRGLLSDVLYRRCRHVVSEIVRTEEARHALETGDLRSLGALINASHDSLRDDYEVSCSQVDTLVDIARSIEGVHGARMVGAGFGGCVLVAVGADQVSAAQSKIVTEFAKETGSNPWSHIVQATFPAGSHCGGTGELSG